MNLQARAGIFAAPGNGSFTRLTGDEAIATIRARLRAAAFVDAHSKDWADGEAKARCGCMILNVALARGFLGRDKCGVMPIRGHSWSGFCAMAG